MKPDLAKLKQRFPNQRLFITGGAGALGFAIAELLSSNGWSVGIFDADAERLTLAESALSGGQQLVQAYPGDVTRSDELTVAVNSFVATAGGLDMMVNCAGMMFANGFAETELEEWRSVLDVNILGVVQACRSAIPHLKHNGKGILLNVANAVAFTSPPGFGAYNASNAATVSLSETLAAELEPSNIQVSVALPGLFKSDASEQGILHGRLRAEAELLRKRCNYSAADAALDIVNAAAAGKTHILAPGRIRALWIYKRLMPGYFVRNFFKQERKRIARLSAKVGRDI